MTTGVTGDFIRFIEDIKTEQKDAMAEATSKTYTTLILKLKRFKKKISYNEVDADFIYAFKNHLKVKEKNNPNTVEKTIGILKKFVRIAVRKRFIGEDPFNTVKVKRLSGSRSFLNEDQLIGLFDYYAKPGTPDNHVQVLRYFLFSCVTGLRLSDVKVINKGNIMGSILILQPIKTRGTQKVVKIPLCSKAFDLIGDIKDRNEKHVLFETQTDQATNRVLKKIMAAVDIKEDISFHSARHTFATIFLRKTKNIAALQKLLGHYSITDTMIYAHVLTEDLQVEMKCFEFITPSVNP